MKRLLLFLAVPHALLFASALPAQTPVPSDSVLARIWTEGMERSRVRPLAQALLDSIGPRLTGSPGMEAANRWAVQRYREWGIDARNEAYGTWQGWRRGITHLDLLEPRVRTLEATLLAWSPGTGRPLRAGTVILPEVSGPEEFEQWLPQARGKLVLLSYAQPSCRPDDSWERWASPETLERFRDRRAQGQAAWNRRISALGFAGGELLARLHRAGAVGVLTSNWSQGWGVNKVFFTSNPDLPALDLGCEDYGLVFRLTENDQAPLLRLHAEAELLGEVPVFNTVAEIRGTELPDEYVVLSAHFDSWHGASGATDNGTGTVAMMEAMRILKEAYPNPRRTILVGHWGGEEQGLNGSRAFAADHPEVVSGIQVLLNQDNGTGRIANIGMEGIVGAGEQFERWLARIPRELAGPVTVRGPGSPSRGGSDHAAFVCHGAPAFFLSSLSWDYGTYTWHTNRDTFDKVVMDEVRGNATLIAMLAYLASEDPERMSRERRSPSFGAGALPACEAPARRSSLGAD